MAAATRMRATCAVPRPGARGARRAATRAVTGAPGAEVSTGAASDFSDERLLEMTVAFNDAQRGAKDPSLLADKFFFIGSVVDPLDKDAFLRAYKSFGFEDAFPDNEENVFGMTVDPLVPNCVWFMTRFKGTHTGTLSGSFEATGKFVELPPTISSVHFDSEGKVTKFTSGYPADRTQGNSGGLTGFFGILYAIGKPLPFREARPYKPSLRFRFFRAFGQLFQRDD